MAKLRNTLVMMLATAAGSALFAAGPASAGMSSTPAGLRAAAAELVSLEQVRSSCRHGGRYRCKYVGSPVGPIIIEPSAPAPRSYYVDYRANAAYHGWFGYYEDFPSLCYGPPYANCPRGWFSW